MTDRIDFGGAPWQAIPRETLRDPRLSHKAKGGLVILLSHDEGWVRSCIAILQREGRGGRDQAQAIMRELRDLGYADLITERDLEGQLRRHYVVRAVPASSGPQTVGTPVGGEPNRRDSQPTENPSIVVEALGVDSLEEDPRRGSKPRAVDNNPNQPTDRQLYFDERLGLGIPAIVKLNKDHGRAAVLSAMEQVHGFPPPDPITDMYGYIATVANFKAVGA